jgi:hypothetical protein
LHRSSVTTILPCNSGPNYQSKNALARGASDKMAARHMTA